MTTQQITKIEVIDYGYSGTWIIANRNMDSAEEVQIARDGETIEGDWDVVSSVTRNDADVPAIRLTPEQKVDAIIAWAESRGLPVARDEVAIDGDGDACWSL